MPSERSVAALREILRNIDLATSFVSELDRTAFGRDLRSLYAVVRCLEIISEASRRLPEAVKDKHPEIAWSDIATAGNIYRHAYEQIVPERIWDTVELSLPLLRAVIAQELSLHE